MSTISVRIDESLVDAARAAANAATLKSLAKLESISVLADGEAAPVAVTKLIGATDGFIRRPFVYFAVFQGVLAALIAWGLSAWLIASANPALAELATLYNDHATLRNLHADEVLILLGGVALLAALGARLATGHILRQIEPQ